MRDLSIVIPARHEKYLKNTIDDILAHIEADTEIIVVLDGEIPIEPIHNHPRVNVIFNPESIGQRASTNQGVRLSTAKFIMKVDAHCSFDQGFDRKLMEDCEPDWTVIPRMYNLHAFDWKCTTCGKRTYQGPVLTQCGDCRGTEFVEVLVWKPREDSKGRRSPTTDFMRFNHELQFKYWHEFKKRSEAVGDICETMSNLGACYFMYRKRYWELNGLDERHGSWGQMGTEISCKTWLSGGRQIINKKTWFAHMFRTQAGFSFPYPISGDQQEQAKAHSRWLWLGNNWDKAVRPFSWIIEHFSPVPDWDEVEVQSD